MEVFAKQVTVDPAVEPSPVAGDQVKVVAPATEIFVFEPLQIVAETGVTVRTGIGLTVINCVPVPVQPADNPVTVYVLVAVVVQLTVVPVDALKPVAGVQE